MTFITSLPEINIKNSKSKNNKTNQKIELQHNELQKNELQNKINKIIFPNDDIYEGEIENNLPHGNGTMIYKDGAKYTGNWKNGKKEGYGIYEFSNDDKNKIYSGLFENDEICGLGLIVYTDNTFYQGEFKRGKCEGYGKYIFDGGNIYEGEWKNEKMEGYGKYIFTNGDIYEGQSIYNKFCGHGVMTYSKGNKFEGIWYNGKRNGYGVMKYKTGKIIKGFWKKNKIDYRKPVSIEDKNNNMNYTGIINNNKERHGHGKEFYDSGYIYEGEWQNNQKIGYGILKKDKVKILQFWKIGHLVDTLNIETDFDFNISDFHNIKINNIHTFSDDEQQELYCPIMTDRFIPVITSCNHKFCKIGLENYQNKRKKMECPLCRKNIDYITNDTDALNILKKCSITINEKPINYTDFAMCYQFIHNWYHNNKVEYNNNDENDYISDFEDSDEDNEDDEDNEEDDEDDEEDDEDNENEDDDEDENEEENDESENED
jgi:hypothetical protein